MKKEIKVGPFTKNYCFQLEPYPRIYVVKDISDDRKALKLQLYDFKGDGTYEVKLPTGFNYRTEDFLKYHAQGKIKEATPPITEAVS